MNQYQYHPDSGLTPRLADSAAARAAAAEIATLAQDEAIKRDQQRIYALRELDLFSQSGLGGLIIPENYGGSGLSYADLSDVFRRIASVDPSLAQIPQNHFGLIQIILGNGSEAQKKMLLGAVASGHRFGNGGPEKNSRHTRDVQARLQKTPNGLRLNGEKFYSTGALFAHIVATTALDDNQRPVLVFIPRPAAGLTIIDDWSGIGQRTTASGTVRLDNVAVDPLWVIALPDASQPTLRGPVSQLMQAAIDAGIAQGALNEALDFVRNASRPWVDANVSRNADDPYILADIGRISVELEAANALLDRAARTLDAIDQRELTADNTARAAIAVAEAKVLTTEVALRASEKLLEWSGSRGTLAQHGLDRHWRNARTHTLHDPVRWKYHAIGDFYLNGTLPARHAWI